MSEYASEKICFFHDPDELFLRNLSITISICLINHLLQLFLCHRFSQLP